MAMIVQATHEHSMTHSRSKSVDLYSILHDRVEKHEPFVYNLRARHGDRSSKRFPAYRHVVKAPKNNVEV